MMQLVIDLNTIAMIVMAIETILVIGLMVGWLYGARRMDFKTHHRAVYPIVLIHSITVGFWMIPIAIARLPIMLANPMAFWYQIVHDMIGFAGIALGIILALLYAFKRDMPLKLLKKTRPIMFLTIGVWSAAFILGLYWFLLGYVLI
ncbi:MAG: hypothetical protein ACFFED_15400 [Candidatus Thorarchaeota archaeon]